MKSVQEYARDVVNLLAGKTTVLDDFGNAIGGGGAGQGNGLNIQDKSTFTQESVATLGSAGSFIGTFYDLTYVNWIAASARADVTGTLFIDTSPTSPNTTNALQAGTQATASQTVTGQSAFFVAIIAPIKTILRYARVRYVNGAGAQASFDLESALSPIY